MSILDGTGVETFKWPEQEWYAAALASPHNSQGTAAALLMKHASAGNSKGASTLPVREYMMGYLQLMHNALAHSELDLTDEVPKLGTFSSEDIRLMELCPLGYASELVDHISAAFGRASTAKQQLSIPQASTALQQHPDQATPEACRAAREARILHRMLVASPSGLRAQAMPRCPGS